MPARRDAESLYYNWSKEFLQAGKKRLAGDTARAATTDEVKVLRRETRDLKEGRRRAGAGTATTGSSSVSNRINLSNIHASLTKTVGHARYPTETAPGFSLFAVQISLSLSNTSKSQRAKLRKCRSNSEGTSERAF